MKIRFILLLCVFQIVCLGLNAQTQVSGTISSNTTWTLTESPYLVTSNITVAENVTLTIDPGVVIKFSNTYHSYHRLEAGEE